MTAMLEHALQYAGRGWPVFPLSGYKMPFKGSHGHLDASTAPEVIRQLWAKRRRANIGLACGAIVVIDADGPEALARLKAIGAALGGLPQTLTAQTSRGLHLYFRAPPGVEVRTRNEPRKVKGADGIDVKGAGGYVLLPPSVNAKTGFTYRWLLDIPPAELPSGLLEALNASHSSNNNAAAFAPFGPKPAWLTKNPQPNQRSTTERASAALTPWSADDEQHIRDALAAIPAVGYDTWRSIGMALHSLGWVRGDGTDIGFEMFDEWSATEEEQYSPEATERKWQSFGRRGGLTIGTLFHIAEQHGWQGNLPLEYQPESEVTPHPIATINPDPVAGHDKTAPHPVFNAGGAYLNGNGFHAGPTLLPGAFTQRPRSPLIELNEKYAVIGDVGGKCMVMGWVPSSADASIVIPSFQAFKSFSERHSNRYVVVRKKRKVLEEADESDEPDDKEFAQLGTAWLKWPQRRTYERVELVPNGERILPGNVLNLWTGFGVVPKQGAWERMRNHIAQVLAAGNVDALNYIVKWAAWAVQNPGKQAGAALVFRGDEGAGKGVFARTMCKIFGQHGVQLYNSKHMVGFNGLLRNCLLLYADEAFWAGDKQGESTLKGLITEPTIVIESKGMNAELWRNMLHVIMTSNADWVVPAGHSSRRYAVFDVANNFKQTPSYFDPLYAELANGGPEAMLYDLLRVDLKGWQPGLIVKNRALEEQKARSLDPLADWYLNLLSDGRLPGAIEGRMVPSAVLIANAQTYSRQLANSLTTTKLGLFLRSVGCIKRTNVGRAGNNGWAFPELHEARQRWEMRMGGWQWDAPELGVWR